MSMDTDIHLMVEKRKAKEGWFRDYKQQPNGELEKELRRIIRSDSEWHSCSMTYRRPWGNRHYEMFAKLANVGIRDGIEIKCGSIDNCCKGKKLSCGGFQWKYGESTECISPIRQSMRKIRVAKYDEQGNFITAYSSCREAARENNLTFQVISECINGKRKTSYGGFVWKKLIENS